MNFFKSYSLLLISEVLFFFWKACYSNFDSICDGFMVIGRGAKSLPLPKNCYTFPTVTVEKLLREPFCNSYPEKG